MPTEALESVLNRDLSRVAAKESIDTATKLLTELVNNSTHVFRRCESSSDGATEDTAFLMLYLHMVEVVDGLQVLIAQSCVATAIPLIRSAFEADLSLRYILKEDSDRRALAWLIGNLLDGILVNGRFDPATSEGQAYQTACATDETMQRIDFAKLTAGAQADLAKYQRLLARPEFSPILAERQAVIAASGKKYPKWYRLFGGPTNLRELARRLGSEGQYLTVYGQWSRISHAEDYARFKRSEKSEDPAVRLLRDSYQMDEIVSFAATFLLRATRLILGKFRPSERIGEWYLKEVRDLYWAMGPRTSNTL